MSEKSAPYYWLECDRCGIKSTENDEYTAWGHVGDAIDRALDDDWHIEGGNHLCWDCQPPDREYDEPSPNPEQGRTEQP